MRPKEGGGGGERGWGRAVHAACRRVLYEVVGHDAGGEHFLGVGGHRKVVALHHFHLPMWGRSEM